MKEKRKRTKKSKRKRLGNLFLRSVMIVFIISLLLLGVAAAAYQVFIYQGGKKEDVLGLIPTVKEKDIYKTFAVFGVDEDGYRTDSIVVINYNSQTNKIKVVSIPRDTKVTWTEKQQQKLKEYDKRKVSVSKINEMTSHGGIENIRDFTIDEIENILHIKIDNYMIITTDALRKIVDAVGGVEVTVPDIGGKGFNYEDSSQNLYIHLKPGLQTLDGEQAEGLVRFRSGYSDGDLGRIKTQQLFLEAFAKRVLSPSIITKVPQIVPAILSSITTDIKLNEIMTYYGYLKKFNSENITFSMIPGESGYQQGKSYFLTDKTKMQEFVEEVFHDKLADREEEVVLVDKHVTIEVLNSTLVNGAAGRTKEELEEAGYNVAAISNYSEERLPQTIIYAKDITKANQFSFYFKDAVIEQKADIDYDIQIILGGNQN